jgi:hypothetical protein
MARHLQLSGTATFIDLNGGFWGIISDDGQRYRPVDGLPVAFQQEGLALRVKAKPVSGFSIFMWGKDIALLDVQTN